MNEKSKGFVKDGLSIDESRVSVLIISYLTSFLVTTAFCAYNNDVESMKSIFFATLTAVAGINITNTVAGKSKPTGLPELDFPEDEAPIVEAVPTQESTTSDWPRN